MIVWFIVSASSCDNHTKVILVMIDWFCLKNRREQSITTDSEGILCSLVWLQDVLHVVFSLTFWKGYRGNYWLREQSMHLYSVLAMQHLFVRNLGKKPSTSKACTHSKMARIDICVEISACFWMPSGSTISSFWLLSSCKLAFNPLFWKKLFLVQIKSWINHWLKKASSIIHVRLPWWCNNKLQETPIINNLTHIIMARLWQALKVCSSGLPEALSTWALSVIVQCYMAHLINNIKRQWLDKPNVPTCCSQE